MQIPMNGVKSTWPAQSQALAVLACTLALICTGCPAKRVASEGAPAYDLVILNGRVIDPE
jgi:hypothetical protein